MQHLILFIVIINPFSQVLYLSELMNDLKFRDFLGVHFKATMLSLSVFLLFCFGGDFIINKWFQVRLGSLQAFGGLINIYVAFRYIAVGQGGNVMFKGNISDLAPQISLPYMVGPAGVWLSILIGKEYNTLIGTSIITAGLLVNFLFVMASYQLFSNSRNYRETMVGKYFGILMRSNALFLGAVGMQMIIDGVMAAVKEYNLL